MDGRRPTSGGAGVGYGPVVFVAALWSWWGSVQPLRMVISICRRRMSPDSSTTSRPRSLEPGTSILTR